VVFAHGGLHGCFCWAIRVEEAATLAPPFHQLLTPSFTAENDFAERWQFGIRHVAQNQRRHHSQRDTFRFQQFNQC
jgi:hypothetical protein